MILFLAFFACEELKLDCSEQQQSLVQTDLAADFRVENAVYPGDSVEDYLNGIGSVMIESWDCVDLAWWTGVDEQKVVQVWSARNTCDGYDTVELFVYDCDAVEGPDIPYRDLDGDGLRPIDGDCDDLDADIGFCDENDETVESE